jgi:hypothetical protein
MIAVAGVGRWWMVEQITTRSPTSKLHFGAYLLDEADALVAKDGAGLHAGKDTMDKVRIHTADSRGGKADNRVGWLLDLRISPTPCQQQLSAWHP